MSSRELAKAINEAIPQWVGVEPVQRAQLVIDWCTRTGIACDLDASQLAAAMRRMPYWNQGPDNYLDFVEAYSAAYVIRVADLIPIAAITLHGEGSPSR